MDLHTFPNKTPSSHDGDPEQNVDEVIDKIQEHHMLKDRNETIAHILFESGYILDKSGQLKKRDLHQRYERLIRIQHRTITQLNEQLNSSKVQHEQLLATLKQNLDLVSNCLKDFGYKAEEVTTPTTPPTPPINSTPPSNPYTFDPMAARTALINSRTKSAPLIEVSGYPMGVGPNRPKNNFPFFSTSTSSLNINKGQLKYPSLTSSFQSFGLNRPKSYSGLVSPDISRESSNEDLSSSTPPPLTKETPKKKVTLLTKSDLLGQSSTIGDAGDTPIKKRKRIEKPMVIVDGANDLCNFADRVVRERENVSEKV